MHRFSVYPFYISIYIVSLNLIAFCRFWPMHCGRTERNTHLSLSRFCHGHLRSVPAKYISDSFILSNFSRTLKRPVYLNKYNSAGDRTVNYTCVNYTCVATTFRLGFKFTFTWFVFCRAASGGLRPPEPPPARLRRAGGGVWVPRSRLPAL